MEGLKQDHLTDEIEYNFFIAPLIGLTNKGADHVFLWNMELEF